MKQGNEEEEKKEILDRTAVTSTQHRSSFPPTFNTTVTIFGFLDRSEVGCWNSSNRHFAQNQFCEIMQKNAWTCVGHTYYTVEIDYCQNKCTKGKKISIHSNSSSSMIRFYIFFEDIGTQSQFLFLINNNISTTEDCCYWWKIQQRTPVDFIVADCNSASNCNMKCSSYHDLWTGKKWSEKKKKMPKSSVVAYFFRNCWFS